MNTSTPSADRQLRGLKGIFVLLLSACVALGLLLAAGGDASRFGLVVSRLVVDGGVVVVWSLAAAGLGSAVLRVSGLGSVGAAMGLGVGWGVMGLATLGLGVVGLVGPVVAWAVVVAGLAAGAWAVRGRLMGVLDVGSGVWVWVGWATAGVLAGVAVFLALFPAGLLWPTEPNGYDVLGYHLQLPREWYEAGAITVLPHNVFSYMPLGMEMHYLLAMGLMGDPWGGMYVAQLMHVAVWIAAAVGAFDLGCRVSTSRAGGWGAAGVLAACPLGLMLAPIAYNEGAVVLYGVLVLRAMWEGLQEAAAGKAARWASLAGVCGGLAAGAKLTAVPLWLVMPALVWACAGWGRRGLVAGLVMLGVGVAVASPWWVRTAVAAGGNPVFPVAAGVLGSPGWDEVRIERFVRAHAPRPDQRSLSGRAAAFWEQVLAAPEFGWVLVPGAWLLGVWGMVRQRGRGGWVWAALLVGHAAVWMGLTHLQGRFWVAALPVMAAMWAAGMSVGWGARVLGGVGLGVSVVVAVGLVWVRLAPFRTPEGRLLTEVVGVDFRAVEGFLVPPEALAVDESVVLNLVGDARGYAYRRPMSRLKYTYVFDVAGDTVESAWRVEPSEWILVSPSELRRLARTYYGIASMPEVWQGLDGPTLMRPGDRRRRE